MITTAFVLGAGFGTRLRPLTENLPKPLLPLGGRPLITWAFDHCLTAGVERFIVNTHHCPAAYGAAFPGGRWRGRPILFRHEPCLLDTAGGLKNIEDLLERDEPLLVYNGDILSDLPLPELLAAHVAGGAEATLALRSAGPVRNVALGADGRVCDLRDLLGNPGVRRCQFTGISIVERRFLGRLTPGRVESTIPVFAGMIGEAPGSVGGVVIDGGLWLDIGDQETYGRFRERGFDPAYGGAAPAGTASLSRGGRSASGAAGHAAGGFAGPAEGPPAAALRAGAGSPGSLKGPAACGTADGAVGAECRVAGGTPARAAKGRKASHAAESSRESFVRAALGLPAGAALTLAPVGKGGSDREYWRICAAGRPLAVLMHYGRLYPENDGWAAVADFLARAGVAVPALYARDRRRRLILLEDLGDGDLYALRDAPWERRRVLYAKTLALTARLHALPPAHLPAGLKLMPGFDEALYRWERDYFRERFVRDVCGIELVGAAAASLEAELAALAGRLLAAPPCLVHRDLQSQNVMLRGGEPVLIDFQGLRPGHRGYDLGSLLWDPYVTFPVGAREALLAIYREAAGSGGGDDAALPAFLAASVQRLMQALGAYGFLGLVRGKPHFLAHIPPALSNLLEVTERAGNLPRLAALVRDCQQAWEGRALMPPPARATGSALDPAGTAEPSTVPPDEGAGGLAGDRRRAVGASASEDETPPDDAGRSRRTHTGTPRGGASR